MSLGNQSPEGMLLGGRYRISRLIGSGGMANVYLAVDLTSGSNVAVKVLKMEYSADKEFIQRFDTEARAAASLSHPNIVRVYGVGQEGQFRYMVQEYVEGITVKELIRQNGYLNWRVVVPVLIQVGMALDHAHENGIIHRDIKPHNILVTKDRVAKVTDFGIARAATSNTITLTSGGAMGSVHYFSPEQARGAMVGPNSDIYSMGVLLFEMLTGRVPFDGDTPVAIAVKHLQEKPPVVAEFVPSIPEGLDNIVQKCLQKSADMRYRSARELVSELDAFMIEPEGTYGVLSEQVSAEENTMQMQGFRQEADYAKMQDIEKSIKKRRRSRIRDNAMVVALVGVIIAVLVAAVYLVYQVIGADFGNSTDMTDQILRVGNYVNMNIEDVKIELERAGFREGIDYVIEWRANDEIPPNVVISQNIVNSDIKPNSGELGRLKLTVSGSADSPSLIYVPDLSGKQYSEIGQILSDIGLRLAERPHNYQEYAASEFPNLIVMWTSPGAGESVEIGREISAYLVTQERYDINKNPTQAPPPPPTTTESETTPEATPEPTPPPETVPVPPPETAPPVVDPIPEENPPENEGG